MDSGAVVLSDIQGRIFEKSSDMGLDSARFAEAFMNSVTARSLDLPRHKLRWAGEASIMDDFLRRRPVPEGQAWNEDAMFWTGFAYRAWHFINFPHGDPGFQAGEEMRFLEKAELIDSPSSRH